MLQCLFWLAGGEASAEEGGEQAGVLPCAMEKLLRSI